MDLPEGVSATFAVVQRRVLARSEAQIALAYAEAAVDAAVADPLLRRVIEVSAASERESLEPSPQMRPDAMRIASHLRALYDERPDLDRRRVVDVYAGLLDRDRMPSLADARARVATR